MLDNSQKLDPFLLEVDIMIWMFVINLIHIPIYLKEQLETIRKEKVCFNKHWTMLNIYMET